MVALADCIRAIDYCRAVGLLILSRNLFGGFRGHHGHHRHCGGEAISADEQDKVRCDLFNRFKAKKDEE